MKKKLLWIGAIVLALATALLSLTLFVGAEEPIPSMSIDYCNLSLRDAVCVKYAAKLDNAETATMLVWETPKAEYVYGTQDAELENSGTQTIGGKKYYVFDYTGLATKQMTDEIYARTYYKTSDGTEYYSPIKKFSILEYAMTALAKPSTAAPLKNLLRSMLNYGAAAQVYQNYNTDRLANATFYRLTVVGGTLSDGMNTGLYPAGASVTLTAPATDSYGMPFDRWEDANGNPVTMPLTTVASDMTYTAVYRKPTTAENFVPVLRFVVGSDTHLANTVTAEDERLVKLFTSAYAYSDAHEDYKGLDGVFIVGDCVDKGTQEAMNRFFDIVEANLREGTFSFNPMGNHEYYTTKNMDGLTGSAIYEETVRMYTEASGYEDVDLHTTIGGYHFIFLSPDGTGWNFSASKQEWLAAELAVAAADDPTGRKPIFVFQHEPVKDTVLGSADGVTTLTEILNAYPQVVDFAGHSHYPLNDPRSIYQEFFTALNTGAMKYLSYDLPGIELEDIANATDYEGGWGFLTDGTVIPDGGAYYIVEISADNALLVRGYDVDGEAFCMEPIFIPSVGEPEEFIYTEDRDGSDKAPTFPEGAELVAGKCDSMSVSATFPQAKDDVYVTHYEVELLEGDKTVATRYLLSGLAQTPVPETRTVSFECLDPGVCYTIRVTPVSAFAVKGETKSIQLTTTALQYTPVALPDADVFELELYGDGLPTDGASGTVLTPSTAGTPYVKYDPSFGMLAAQFNGAANYLYEGISTKYDSIRNAMSAEMLLRVDEVTGGYDCPFSNQQSGGFGFNVNSGNTIDFCFNIGGTYYKASGRFVPGRVFHAVGTYDGSALRLYLNGVLVDETPVSGSMKDPSTKYLSIGADTQPSKVGDAPLTGALAVANLYSRALTKDEICSLYVDYRSEADEADVFDLELKAEGLPTDGVSGDELTASTQGTPTVEVDPSFGMLAAQFHDAESYQYAGIADRYSKVSNSITMELLARIDEVTGSYDYVFSNFDSGGFGFTAYADGRLTFGVHIGGAYQTLTGAYTIGEVFYAVGTYDGSEVKLYINGALADSLAISGTIKEPQKAAHRYLGIGADSGMGAAGDAPITGAIADANIYSYALTRTQIRKLYHQYNTLPVADVFSLELHDKDSPLMLCRAIS